MCQSQATSLMYHHKQRTDRINICSPATAECKRYWILEIAYVFLFLNSILAFKGTQLHSAVPFFPGIRFLYVCMYASAC